MAELWCFGKSRGIPAFSDREIILFSVAFELQYDKPIAEEDGQYVGILHALGAHEVREKLIEVFSLSGRCTQGK